jgi:GT2 family glycosyltransferase
MFTRITSSIVIVTFNTKELTRNCLTSLHPACRGLSSEVIVVDNNSFDGTSAMIRSEFPEVVLVPNPRNVGFAAANNQGISGSKGEYILCLNSDTILREDALRNTLDFMRSHPEASIVGVRLLNKDGTIQQSCRSFPSVLNVFSEAFFLYKILPKNRVLGKYYLGWFTYDEVQEVDVILGAFMMIRRSVFDKIGLFDERFFIFTEETDFCLRASRAGLKTYFYPGAEVIHLGGQSAEQDPQRMFRDIYRTQIYLFRKHYASLEYVFMVLFRTIGVAIRVIVYALIGLLLVKPGYFRKSKYYLMVFFN